MANEFFTGTEGVIKLGSTALVQVASFAYSIANMTGKMRSKGDPYPYRKSIGRDLTGSLAINWNPTNADHVALQAAVAAGTEVSLVLYPTGASTGKKVTVSAQLSKFELTSVEPESTDPIQATMEFECTGAPVIADAA